jgi:outer membrane protein assembly factor BamE (lipoprotein component of BamABCDE complex)
MKRLLALIPLFALSGCVYMQDTHLHRKGSEISKEQVAQVEPGKTDKAWILKNLGTPDRLHADRDGLEVFEYVSERTSRTESRFILLFSIESDHVVSRKVTRVVLRNGLVESISTNDA